MKGMRESDHGYLIRAASRFAVAVASLFIVIAPAAQSGALEEAHRMHLRLAAVPPAPDVLTGMRDQIAGGNPLAAALIAMENPNFYTVTLRNFAAPWTNRDQSPFVPLNDYTTLVIGMVRDGVPFDRVLWDDLLYVGAGVSPSPDAASNAHYAALEQRMMEDDFDPHTGLVASTQSARYGTPQNATAGAMTTRAAAEAFFVAGTNRAMLRFTLINHLCVDLEQLHDASTIPDRIRQDVSRGPGGDSRVFLNNCLGCHAGMDPLAQAFAYYDFDETQQRMQYTAGNVHPKYFLNEDTFADGYVTPDDAWENYWREGRNALLGWSSGLPGHGNGAKSMGRELAGSEAFAQCQVRKVFNTVCLRDPIDAQDRAVVSAITSSFRNDYDLRGVFAAAAVHCMAE
jgi:hypothetical protein